MAIEVRHLEHTYTYRHPVGWSGGNEHICEKLNASLPAGDYPPDEAEKIALHHALASALAGGEVIKPESGRRVPQGPVDTGVEEASVSAPDKEPGRILEEPGAENRPHDPDRIIEERGDEEGSGGDPDRILEG